MRNDLFLSFAKGDSLEVPLSELRSVHNHLNVELTEECESILYYLCYYCYYYVMNEIEKLMEIEHSSIILPLNREVFDEYVDYLTILRSNSILIFICLFIFIIFIESTVYKTKCENNSRCFYNYLNPFMDLENMLRNEFSSTVEEGKMKNHNKSELVSCVYNDVSYNENVIPDYINDYLSRSKCSVELIDNLPFLKNCVGE